MVIERYKDRDAVAVYRRAKERGRMLPEGLTYIDSWVETNYDRCYQLMQTDNESLFAQWTRSWSDLVDFEIVPVVTSAEASARVAPSL